MENINKCSSNSMCFMCWDYCDHLYRESRLVTVSMCSDYVCVSILIKRFSVRIDSLFIFYSYSTLDASSHALTTR